MLAWFIEEAGRAVIPFADVHYVVALGDWVKYVKHIYEKLDVHHRAAAVTCAQELALL